MLVGFRSCCSMYAFRSRGLERVCKAAMEEARVFRLSNRTAFWWWYTAIGRGIGCVGHTHRRGPDLADSVVGKWEVGRQTCLPTHRFGRPLAKPLALCCSVFCTRLSLEIDNFVALLICTSIPEDSDGHMLETYLFILRRTLRQA